MLADPPPATVPLADFDRYRWRLYAACPACKGYRSVSGKARGRTPVLALFDRGKVTCKLHGQPAHRLKIVRFVNMLMGEVPVEEWDRSG